MRRGALVWAGGILVAVAAGLGGYVAGVGLEEGDRLASVIAAITGLAGLGVALYGLTQPSPTGVASARPSAEALAVTDPAAQPAEAEPQSSPSPSAPPGAGRSYGGDHVEIHGTFHGLVQGKGTQHNPPSPPPPSQP